MMPGFQRDGYQSVTLKLIDPSAFESFAAALAADPRLDLKPYPERDYYQGQSETTGTLIGVFATFVTAILSIGAVFGAMNTMYAAVAYRTREIGTLRAPGFSRSRIVSAFLVESMALALIGGAIGCLLALPVHGLSTGAMNMTSFSELAFKIPDHAWPAGQRPDFFRGDGSGRRPASGALRGPHPCRPRPSRDLTCCRTSSRSPSSGWCRPRPCWSSPCRSAGRWSRCGRCRTSCAPSA